MASELLYEVHGGIAWITLNRPDAMNAICDALRVAIPEAIARVLDLVLSADQVSAEGALRMGLVSRVVPRADLMNTAEALAQRIASHAPLSVMLAKEAVRSSLNTDLATGLKIEADLSTLIASTEDRAEAGKAFREKRDPDFKGR